MTGVLIFPSLCMWWQYQITLIQVNVWPDYSESYTLKTTSHQGIAWEFAHFGISFTGCDENLCQYHSCLIWQREVMLPYLDCWQWDKKTACWAVKVAQLCCFRIWYYHSIVYLGATFLNSTTPQVRSITNVIFNKENGMFKKFIQSYFNLLSILLSCSFPRLSFLFL